MSAPAAPYEIVHEDEAVLVVDKAPGVLTVSHPGASGRCLLDHLRAGGHAVAPVHRLDRETSGLLLLCLSREHRSTLERQFRRRRVTKEYLALVEGRPRAPRATIDVPILDEGATARVDRRGRRAVTRYEVVEERPGGLTLLRLAIETGRHNQIRVHLAHLGTPIAGDRKFGSRGRRTAPRTLLHACRLAFDHPVTGARIDLSRPPPADFGAPGA